MLIAWFYQSRERIETLSDHLLEKEKERRIYLLTYQILHQRQTLKKPEVLVRCQGN